MKDEEIREWARGLNAIIAEEERILDGEEQIAMLCRYYFRRGWVSELSKVIADRKLWPEAFLKIAEWELNQKLIAEEKWDDLKKRKTLSKG